MHKKLNRLNQIDYEKKQIQVETKVLLQAEKAIKTAKIREVSSHYPDLKTAGQYLTYENALELEKHIELAQKTSLTLPVIESSMKNAQNKLYKLEKDIKIIQVEKDHLDTMSKQVKQLEKVEEKLDQLSNHPGEKAKRLVSKKARQHYEELESEARYCKDNLNQMGYKGREDLNQRQGRMQDIEEKTVPSLEKQITFQKTGLEGLNTLFDAIQQATRSEIQAQQKHQLRKVRNKNQTRSINKGPDLSL